MIVILAVPLAVIAAISAAVLQRRHGRVDGDRLARACALSLAILFSVFAGLFIVGETAEDPGGAAALALVASWLVPMVLLMALAWWWPRAAGWVLGIAVVAVVALGLWYAADPQWWRTLEDDRGPVRAVLVFALSLPLALLAWRRPRVGGALLVVLGVVPGLLALLSTGRGGSGSAVVAASSPAAVIGALFLLSAWLEQRGDQGTLGQDADGRDATAR
jgi:hypothetical protein